MGKLADRLKAMARGSASSIGFASRATSAQPPALLVAALLDSAQREAAADAVAAGADAVLVPAGPATKDAQLKEVATAAQQAMWGALIENGGREDVERLQKMGCDLVVLQSGSLPADTLMEEKIDKLLEVDPAWEDTLVRTIERLPVLGVLFRLASGETLTIHQLLQCQRVVGLTRKPAFALLPPGFSATQLALLRDAGVSGIVVAPAMVRDFRTAVRDLPPPKKPQEHAEALLPLGLLRPHEEPEEEEEEEE